MKTKYSNFAKRFVMALAVVLMAGNVWGADPTKITTFTESNLFSVDGWSKTSGPSGETWMNSCVQLPWSDIKTTNLVLSNSTDFAGKTIKGVSVNYYCNGSGSGSMTVTVGGNTFGSAQILSGGNTGTHNNASTTGSATGTIEITFGSVTNDKKRLFIQSITVTYANSAPTTTVTSDPTSITFDANTLADGGEGSATITSISVTNGYKKSGNFLNVWTETEETHCLFTVNGDYLYASGNNTSISNLSVEYLADATGTFTGNVIIEGYNSSYTAVNCTIPLSVTITAGCTNAVAIDKGTENNASLSFSSTSVQTCSGTATDRQVTVSVVPASCYAAPVAASVTTTGTAATQISGPTWNSTTSKYDYVYEFAQNAKDATTFAVNLSTKTTYTVNYNKGTYGTGANSSDTKTCGVDLTLPGVSFTRTGYTQAGWSTAQAGTSKAYELSGSYTANNATTLYPYWSANTYSITYKDQNDEEFSGMQTSAPTQHTYGTATTLKSPTKVGYTFDGWFTVADCESGAVGNTLAANGYTDNITLYAKWTLKSCTVTFDKNGGDEGSNSVTAEYGKALPTIIPPTRLHYIFNGYYDSETNNNGSGTLYYNADGTSAKAWDKDVTTNQTLYAKWTEHTYTNYRTICCTPWDDPEVSYSSSSISVNGTATVSITGTTHGTVSYESSNEGVLTVDEDGTVTGVTAGVAHVTVSWTAADGYCEKAVNSADITVMGNVTVTFDANGGSSTMEPQSIPVSTATALTANGFTAPDCKRFAHWNTESDDSGETTYADKASVTITEGMTLYAIWEKIPYTITKGTNSGAETFELSPASSVDCGGTITVTCAPDYEHTGDPTITATEGKYDEITKIDDNTYQITGVSGDITVAISYTAKTVYNITWKVGGVALEDEDLEGVTTSVVEGNGLVTLPTVANSAVGTDLTFMGWTAGSELTGMGNSAPSDLFTAAGSEPTIEGNVTYHAVFAKQTAEASDSWDLCEAVDDVTAGDYVITWNNTYYLPSETAVNKDPDAASGITVNTNEDALTNTVTSEMQWSLAGNNTDGFTIRHKKNTTTYRLGAVDVAEGIKITTSDENSVTYLWTVDIDATDGMRLHSAGTTRYLAVKGTDDWRYYAPANYSGTMRLYKHNVVEAAYADYITKVVALSSIAITTAPDKTAYKKGDILDLTNMVVTATYEGGSSHAVTGYTVEPNTSTALTDETKFTVSYTEGAETRTAEQAIKVYELSGIAITAGPTTTTYKSGATLSTAGMEVTATWGGEALDKIVETVDGYTVDLSTNLATTDTKFEVSYTSAGVEKTATKEIHVYDLSGISITAPTKTTYTAGDVFDPAGMEVTATWGGEALDKIVETVDGYTYSEEPLVNDADDPANVNVTISYTSNGVTKTATQEVTVNPKAKKIMTWHVANEDPFTTRIYVNAQDKYILAMADDPDPVAAGFTSDYVFKGWTTATSVNKDGSEITYASAGAEMSDDEDFYAVFAQKNGEDKAAGYRIVDEAPANGQTVIIARKVSSTYYAMTNSATPSYDALTLSSGVISGTTTSYQWSVASATSGVYLKKSTDYLHMNSKALAVASETTNGDVVFSSNGNGTYKATRADGNRWIVAGGTYGFDCSATEEDALALYIFKYAAATVATYSNYRLVPSTVAVPTGLEAGTYYCASKSITLSQAAGKPIYYTLDGSTPDKNAMKYSSAIVLNTSKTIKAVAYDSDLDDYSGVVSAEYTIVTSIAAPTMTAATTFYGENMNVEMSHGLTSEGAVIHYSYDDASYSDYSDALTIDETKTVYAYATIGELTSEKVNTTYTKGVTYYYKKVTSDAGLAVGMKFIIVSGTNGAGAIDGDHLLKVTVPDPNAQSEIAITNQAVKEFTLGGRSGAYQLVSDQGELGSNNAKSLSYTLGTKTWTISYSGEQVTIENTTTTYGSLQYNSNGTRFNTYTSAQSAIDIYALPFTAHTLTIKDYDGENKLTAKVVEGGSFVLTSADAPSNTPGATYVFLNKWTDGTNTYEVNEAVPVGNADVTLQPCWKVTPTANTDINDLPTSVTEIVVTDGKTLEISAGRSLDNLIVEAGGKVSIAENKTLTVNTFTIESTMASGKSGQLNGATVDNFEASEAYIDITLGADGTNQQWHAFTVPFPVDVMNGIYDINGNKLDNEVNYAIMEYHGDERAKGNYGWKKIRTTLVPGTFYIMATDGYRTTYRFKKKAGEPLVAANSKDLAKNAVSGDGEDGKDNGWNGVGNPTLMYGKVGYNVYVLNPNPLVYDYELKIANSTNFVVGTPFFIQAADAGTMSMVEANASANYAPARVQATEIMNVDVTFGNEVYTDHLYISASEDALNEYQTGKDLVKMTMSNTPRVGRIFSNAYGHQLTMVYAPLSNDQAIYDLSLYAPQAGTYSIAVPNDVDATIYLTYEGSIIWDLTASAYEIDLTKGTTEGYGLILRTNAPAVVTGVDQIDAKAGAQKVIINEHVYILRGGQMYDVNGKMVK